MVLIIVSCLLIVIIIAIVKDVIVSEINKRKTGISIKESLDLTDIPVVTFKNGGDKYNFILDTGSTVSHINKKLLSSIKEYDEIPEMFSQGLVSGTSIDTSTLYSYINMPLQYKKLNFSEDFIVIDLDEQFNSIKEETGVQIHGILGSSFLKKYKYVIDFDDLIAYIK